MTLKKIFSYRSCFMGIAIIWAVLHHLSFDFPGHLLTAIKETADCSIDIFMLCSGIGCYYSFKRDNDICAFYKRRTVKIMSVYFVFMLFWIVWKICTSKITFLSAVGNFFAVEYFFSPDTAFNWYISGIWVMYLLAPLFIKLILKNNKPYIAVAVIAVLVILSLPVWNTARYMSIIVNRIPSFFLGIYIASLGEDHKISGKSFAVFIPIMLLGMTLTYIANKIIYYYDSDFSMRWYQYSLITPGLCLILSFIFRYIEKFKVGEFIIKIFSVIGKYTLPVYLTHLTIFSIKFVDASDEASYALLWIIRILSIIPASIIISYLGKKCEKLLRKALKV